MKPRRYELIWLCLPYCFYINDLPKEGYKIVQGIAIFNCVFFAVDLGCSKSCAKQVNKPIFIFLYFYNNFVF